MELIANLMIEQNVGEGLRKWWQRGVQKMVNKETAIVDMLSALIPDLSINIMYGFDCIETPEGGIGFGVYDVKNRTIYVAGDMPDADYEIPYTIFHELYHDYEIVNGLKSDEDKADDFAETMCKVLGIKRSEENEK